MKRNSSLERARWRTSSRRPYESIEPSPGNEDACRVCGKLVQMGEPTLRVVNRIVVAHLACGWLTSKERAALQTIAAGKYVDPNLAEMRPLVGFGWIKTKGIVHNGRTVVLVAITDAGRRELEKPYAAPVS